MGYRLMPVEGGTPVEDRAPATGGTARS
jgi:hypothetical protein